jgi:benzoate/toluate 1,2-dioxygenase beta subunit
MADQRPSDPSAAAIAFVYREARLLDERAFEAWADLFAPDGIYWVPLQPGQTDGVNQMSIFRDDRSLLLARVARLRHADPHADTPPPRTVHMLSNLEVLPGSEDEVRVAGALLMAEWREQRQTLYIGRVNWTLAPWDAGDYRIRLKRVELVNCDGFHQYLTVPF